MRVVVVFLLFLGMGIQVICAIGVLVMSDLFDRIHYAGPSSLGVLAVAAAIVVDDGFSVAGVKAILVAVVVFVGNPVLAHATARAGRVRQFGHWVAMPAERADDR
jgi:multicomponent Na+:H+ antiporter subunit G